MTLQTARTRLFETAAGFQASSILGAAAELDLFTAILKKGTVTACELARSESLDLRALPVLLDALTVLGFLRKENESYSVPEEYAALLDSGDPETVIPMLRHKLSCQRQWSQLAWTVKSGIPAPSHASIRGPLGDNESFILGMNSISREVVETLVPKMKRAGLLKFSRMLDLGGASGSYTIAMLRENRDATAVILDLPGALRQAEKRIKSVKEGERISLYEADFYRDPFPTGFDFVWISAIIHQQDDAATEMMFRKTYDALVPGGRIAIRDTFLEPDGTSPAFASFFAVNMLSNTARGKVYTVAGTLRLLTAAGFRAPELALPSEEMSGVIVATK